MRRFWSRATAVAAALSITAASAGAVGAAPAAPAADPLSTTTVEKALLRLTLGSTTDVNQRLLGVGVLVDRGTDSIDGVKLQRQANAALIPLELSSSIKLINDIGGQLPRFEAKHDGNKDVEAALVDLGGATKGATLPVLNLPLVQGQVAPLKLTADLTNSLAKSTIDDKLVNLNIAAGLVAVKAVTDSAVATAGVENAKGNKDHNVNGVVFGSLPGLLGMAGVNDLTNLDLKVVEGLLKFAGVKLDLPNAGVGLTETVNSLLTSIDSFEAVTAANAGTADQVTKDVKQAADTVNRLAPTLPVLKTSQTTAVETPKLLEEPVKTTLGLLQGTLQNVLGGALKALNNAPPLLELDVANLKVDTLATDKVETSAANAVAHLGSIQVLGNEALNLDVLNNLLNTLNGILNLPGLLKVQALHKDTSVDIVDGYVKAVADAAVLKVNVLALGDLLGNAANPLLGGTSAKSAASQAALPVNLLGSQPTDGTGLGGLLGGVTGVLSKGITLELLPAKSVSEFKAAAVTTGAPTTPGQPDGPVAVAQLPRTGAENNLFAAAAVVLMLLSLGIRRSLRRAEAITQ